MGWGATRAGVVASVLFAAAMLSACSSNGSPSTAPSTVVTNTSGTTASTTTTSSSTSGAAACTKSLITAAAMASTIVSPVNAVAGFGCAGSWAYANVTVGSGSASYDAVIVLQAQGPSWSVVDRGNACNNHLVPSAIYPQACTTS